MGQYLRDEQLSNFTIDDDALSQLVDIFENRQLSMPERVANPAGASPNTFLIMTIRFDEKGYRVFDKDRLLTLFHQARQVERVVFELISADALKSNRMLGSYIDLRLDKHEGVVCFLTVSSDDEDWVNGSFSAVREALQKYKNRNALIRNPLVELLIQLFGLFIAFIVSLWGAANIAPHLAIENAFLISFLLVLLLFSSLWGPIRGLLLKTVNRSFPTFRFYRADKDRLHWMYQAVVGGVVVAGTLFLLSKAFSYIGVVLGKFMEAGK